MDGRVEDDAATLEAALALIDEWDAEFSTSGRCASVSAIERGNGGEHSSSTSSTIDSDVGSSTPPPASPDTKPSKHKSREEGASRRRKATLEDDGQSFRSRREELVLLWRRVRELEANLKELQQNEETQNGRQEIQELDPLRVWQQIASRQLEHRRNSERENLQLRVQVQEQVRIAKELMRILFRAYGEARKAATSSKNNKAKRIKFKMPEVSTEDQVRRVDELYRQSGDVFSAAPFTGGPPVFRETQMLEHENGEVTICVQSSWVLPFGVTEITDVLWLYIVRKTQYTDCKVNEIEKPDNDCDLLVTDYESAGSSRHLIGKLRGCFVARRVRSQHNGPSFVMWDKRANPVEFKPMSMDGIYMRNEAAMRVIDAQQTTSASSATMSLIQINQRVQIMFTTAETPTRRRRVGALTDYLMHFAEVEFEWRQQVLESLLLQSSLPPRPDPAQTLSYSNLSLQSLS